MEPHRTPEPVFGKVNPVVLALAVIVGGLELLFLAGEQGWLGGGADIASRRYAIIDYAFWAENFKAAVASGEFDTGVLVTLVSYPLIHLSFTHALFSVAFILAIGNTISRIFGPTGLLLVFFIPGIAGALVYGMTSDSQFPLTGATPAVFGYVGALGAMLTLSFDRADSGRMTKLLTIPVFLLAVPTLFNIFLGETEIWKADLAGFAAGFISTVVSIPGGTSTLIRLLRAIRNREK
ncbi:MAG: rhomboid family intramembrane serine protease [Albidovulum sp.]|nr:rhomboid family intramembrane serine protease [Albidovulum sp.]